MNKIKKVYITIIVIFVITLTLALIGVKSHAILLPETTIERELTEIFSQDSGSKLKTITEDIFEKTEEDSLSEPVKTSLEDLGINMALDDKGRVFISKEVQDIIETMMDELYEIFLNPVVRASFFGLLIFILIILSMKFIFVIVKFIAKWKVYNKAGKPGWGLLIPVYKNVLLLEMAGLSPALLLLYLTVFIPFAGPIIVLISFFVLRIITAVNISKAFGKHGAFSIGLIFLPTIFYGILGFGKAEYKSVKEEEKQEKVIEAQIEDVKEEKSKTTKSTTKTSTTKQQKDTK